MEIENVRQQLEDLLVLFHDRQKSTDDIIFSTMSYLKNAHLVARFLLLEGRFAEMKRCLDLCRCAFVDATFAGLMNTCSRADALKLARVASHSPFDHAGPTVGGGAASGMGNTVGSSGGAWGGPFPTTPRSVHQSTIVESSMSGVFPSRPRTPYRGEPCVSPWYLTAGDEEDDFMGVDGCCRPPTTLQLSAEDKRLLEALQDRTAQLQRQCDYARDIRPGRDTQYYIKKLKLQLSTPSPSRLTPPLAHETEEDRPHTPPERGVSLGRRTQLNQYKILRDLPPLVTSAEPFFSRRSDKDTAVEDDGGEANVKKLYRALQEKGNVIDAGWDDSDEDYGREKTPLYMKAVDPGILTTPNDSLEDLPKKPHPRPVSLMAHHNETDEFRDRAPLFVPQPQITLPEMKKHILGYKRRSLTESFNLMRAHRSPSTGLTPYRLLSPDAAGSASSNPGGTAAMGGGHLASLYSHASASPVGSNPYAVSSSEGWRIGSQSDLYGEDEEMEEDVDEDIERSRSWALDNARRSDASVLGNTMVSSYLESSGNPLLTSRSLLRFARQPLVPADEVASRSMRQIQKAEALMWRAESHLSVLHNRSNSLIDYHGTLNRPKPLALQEGVKILPLLFSSYAGKGESKEADVESRGSESTVEESSRPNSSVIRKRNSRRSRGLGRSTDEDDEGNPSRADSDAVGNSGSSRSMFVAQYTEALLSNTERPSLDRPSLVAASCQATESTPSQRGVPQASTDESLQLSSPLLQSKGAKEGTGLPSEQSGSGDFFGSGSYSGKFGDRRLPHPPYYSMTAAGVSMGTSVPSDISVTAMPLLRSDSQYRAGNSANPVSPHGDSVRRGSLDPSLEVKWSGRAGEEQQAGGRQALSVRHQQSGSSYLVPTAFAAGSPSYTTLMEDQEERTNTPCDSSRSREVFHLDERMRKLPPNMSLPLSQRDRMVLLETAPYHFDEHIRDIVYNRLKDNVYAEETQKPAGSVGSAGSSSHKEDQGGLLRIQSSIIGDETASLRQAPSSSSMKPSHASDVLSPTITSVSRVSNGNVVARPSQRKSSAALHPLTFHRHTRTASSKGFSQLEESSVSLPQSQATQPPASATTESPTRLFFSCSSAGYVPSVIAHNTLPPQPHPPLSVREQRTPSPNDGNFLCGPLTETMAAFRIQRAWRKYAAEHKLTHRQVMTEYLLEMRECRDAAAVVIQTAIRCYLSYLSCRRMLQDHAKQRAPLPNINSSCFSHEESGMHSPPISFRSAGFDDTANPMEDHSALSVGSAPIPISLYDVPQGFKGTARSIALRRLQKRCAARVIERAYLTHRVRSQDTREAKAMLMYVTGKCSREYLVRIAGLDNDEVFSPVENRTPVEF